MTKKTYRRVMTIAGSDPVGGAGIQADIKTISACKCYATSALTAVVDENTVHVRGIHEIPPAFVVGQIESILEDVGTDAVKTGMLYSAELVSAVAETLRRLDAPNIVVDPVMVATSGDALAHGDLASAMKNTLMPMARIITPNVPEAETLLQRKISTFAEMKDAAFDLAAEIGTAVLLKGGHINEKQTSIDILCDPATKTLVELPADRIGTQNTHGTGCTLSSAIASYLAHGKTLLAAVTAAKDYINNAIAAGAQYSIGKGHGPVCHFYETFE